MSKVAVPPTQIVVSGEATICDCALPKRVRAIKKTNNLLIISYSGCVFIKSGAS